MTICPELLLICKRNFRIEDQTKNNEYHRFVEGHLIVKQGILYKKKGFFPKKRMFLLTEGPHLYYVDPDKMVLKGEIPWSSKLRTEIRDFRVFFVHVPGRTYYLVSCLIFVKVYSIRLIRSSNYRVKVDFKSV